MNVIYVRSDLLTESFIELRIAVEFLSERNYGYEILTHSLTHSLTHVDYLGQRLFVKYFFKDSLTNCVGGSFFSADESEKSFNLHKFEDVLRKEMLANWNIGVR